MSFDSGFINWKLIRKEIDDASCAENRLKRYLDERLKENEISKQKLTNLISILEKDSFINNIDSSKVISPVVFDNQKLYIEKINKNYEDDKRIVEERYNDFENRLKSEFLSLDTKISRMIDEEDDL